MSIVIITGAPGSGKTYYAVNHLLRKHFFYDKVLHEYMPKHRLSLVTNIDSFRLDHVSLSEVLTRTPLETFFTVEHQVEFLKERPGLVYIIDEVQQFFNVRFSCNEVLYFFEYHRHLGIDFYLICPDDENLARRLRTLAEFVIKAKNRSARVLSEFRYTKFIQGEKVGMVVLRPSLDVFRLYRSMMKSEGSKVKSFVRKYFVVAGVGMIALPLCLFAVINYFFGTHTKKVREVQPAQASSSPAPVSPSPALRLSPSAVYVVRTLTGDPLDLDTFKKTYIPLRSITLGDKTVFVDDNAEIYSAEFLSSIRSRIVYYENRVYVPRREGQQVAERPAPAAGARMTVGGSLVRPSYLPPAPSSPSVSKKEEGQVYVIKHQSPTHRYR
jgi:hypothetical protein